MSSPQIAKVADLFRVTSKLVPVPDPRDIDDFYKWLVNLADSLKAISAIAPESVTQETVESLKTLLANKHAASLLIDIVSRVAISKRRGCLTSRDIVVSVLFNLPKAERVKDESSARHSDRPNCESCCQAGPCAGPG